MAPTWNLLIEVSGSTKSWTVCPSMEEARAAAGLQSGGRGQEIETDSRSGFSHFKVTTIRKGTVSLDDIDNHAEERFFTWSDELKKVNLGALESDSSDVVLKARMTETGKLAWDLPEHLRASSLPEVSAETKDQPRRKPVKASPQEKKKQVQVAEATVEVLWGKTFKVPGHKVGAGSYHFLDDKSAYLNYEKMPGHWKLDDGSPYSSVARLSFEEVSYDDSRRNFKGTINWPVSSKARWVYDIFFDERFIGISGTCKMYRYQAAPNAEPYCLIRFGKDAKYVIETATEAQIQWYYDNYDLDSETKRIIEIMGEVVEKDRKAREASGRGKANAKESMGLVFGQAMQIYARDKAADAMLGESFPMRTGAKLGRPTRWDRTPKG
eukprot:CAMPEP_0197630344 /NCGR_PEP_ID=MMETSP1338-20131121/7862_1 /TAXON_ID=43686 ORGANISM="Pelagodinium beii, Strain RCC1491" /NCGR_SAMPLE_ID=MMETSP1338 /ASSEMBLY_ACC=CAM_ASM_000754 /LENGTH=380 /DNA_ID=CAMNT_0043201545 /DNA_START=31 /DNA_END=1173 /DNA_ORIENTATION=+